jgi:hypothetical protein
VRPTTSRGLNSGGWAARPVRARAESGDKIKERVECSSGRRRGGKGTFIVAKRRGGAMPRSGGLNRKRQRTSNDFTPQCYILGQWLPKTAVFDAVFDAVCTEYLMARDRVSSTIKRSAAQGWHLDAIGPPKY